MVTPRMLNVAKSVRHCPRMLLVLVFAFLLLSPQVSYLAGTAAGDLDPTFGTLGKVKTDFFGYWDEAHAIALQPDNKIIAAGIIVSPQFNFNTDLGLARYNPDGSLDPTFGSGGKVTTDLRGLQETAEDMAIQPDGKIIVAGRTSNAGPLSGSQFVVLRYNPNGSLDSTFGVGGIVTTGFLRSGGAALAVALQPDGKIVAAGVGFIEEETGPGGISQVSVLARYNTDGSLDPTFGTGGRVIGHQAEIRDIALQPDGKIVTVGGFFLELGRLNTDGTPDSSFGSGGQINQSRLGNFLSLGNGVVIQTDGKIVCAGSATNLSTSVSGFALLRFNPNGSLDTFFGSGGLTFTDIGNEDGARDIALQTDGKIVIAGTTNGQFAVLRYNTNGSLDPTFRLVTPDFGCAPIANPTNRAFAMAIQPDGQIIAAGMACWPSDFALARYNGNSNFDRCIQDEGSGDTLLFNSTTGNYQFIACRNQFVVGGTGTLIRRGNTFSLQHFTPDRRVLVQFDASTNKGTATIQILSTGARFTITDQNTSNNSCSCP